MADTRTLGKGPRKWRVRDREETFNEKGHKRREGGG